MQLAQLLATYTKVMDWAGDKVEVHGVVADVREVQPGCLFVAIPRTGVNDCSMISEALKGGAVAIAGERPAEELNDLLWGDFTHVRVEDATAAWCHLRDSWGRLCQSGAVSA
jgi:UDP-N-acetylmuramyl pentapeptide synthase